MEELKKIAIFGSYNGSSIGDTAILLGLLSSIERVYGSNLEVNVLVMNHLGIKKECLALGIKVNVREIVITEFLKTTNFIQSIALLYKKFANKYTNTQVVKESTLRFGLTDVDYLLVGGGNLIMDLYPNSPQLIQKICDFAISQKIKYSFVGVGAGPISTEPGRHIFKNVLQNAEHVFFRDEKSLSLAQRIFRSTKYSLVPDLALGIDVTQDSSINRNTLLINVASVYGQGWPIQNKEKHRDYIHNLVVITKKLIKSKEFDKTILFYSNYPLDRVGGEAYISEFKKEGVEIEEINKKLKVSEIISLGRSAKLALVTRLHAGIMVSRGGASIAAVSYQPKVRDVLGESEISSSFFKMDFNNRGEVVQQVLANIDQKPMIQPEMAFEKIDGALADILDAE